MNAGLTPAAHLAPRPSGWRLVGRWLLLWLVAFDLLSSPLHAHAHHNAGGTDHIAGHHVEFHVGETLFVDSHAHHAFEHGLTGLRAAEHQRLSPGARPVHLGPLTAASQAVPSSICDLWLSRAQPVVANAGDTYLRPESRAPPLRVFA